MKAAIVVLIILSIGFSIWLYSYKKEVAEKEEKERVMFKGYTGRELLASLRIDWKNKFMESQRIQLNDGSRPAWMAAIIAENDKKGNVTDIEEDITGQIQIAFQKAEKPSKTKWGQSWIFSTVTTKYKLDPYNTKLKKLTNQI